MTKLQFFVFLVVVVTAIEAGLVGPSLIDLYGPCRDMVVYEASPWAWRRCPVGARGTPIHDGMLRCECIAPGH